MRGGVSLLLVVALTAASALPVAAQSGQPRPPGLPSELPKPEKILKYYLHEKPCGTYSLDLKDTEGDQEVCYTTEPALEPFQRSYAASEPMNHAVKQYYQARYAIYVTSEHPNDLQVTVRIDLGGVGCGSPFMGGPRGGDDRGMVHNTRTQAGQWSLIEGGCFFQGASASTAKPAIHLSFNRLLSHAVGYEADHASMVEFGVDDLQLGNGTRTNETTPTPAPARGAASVGLPLLVAALAGLVVVARRRE